MIQKTQAFKSSDGKIYAALEAAQHAELRHLLEGEIKDDFSSSQYDLVAFALRKHAPKVIDILTTTATSIPAARAVNGNKRPRKKKHIAEQFPLTGVEPTTANP